jgi:ubiquinone/menaquinone biosynthesis C-methylase UbiE
MKLFSAEELTRSAARLAADPADKYHLAELKVGLNPLNPAHSLPVIEAGEKVLDIGCGAGQTLIASCAYREPGEGGLCVSCSRMDCPTWGYGIDIDESALALGQKWSSRMVLRGGRAEQIPFPDEDFDVVVSRVAIVYTDLPVAAREMRRVLKPGGRLWLTLHPFSMVLRQLRAPKSWLYMAYVALNGLIFHFTLKTASVFGRCESWQTRSGMKRLLARTGFTEIEFHVTDRCFLVTARAQPRESS